MQITTASTGEVIKISKISLVVNYYQRKYHFRICIAIQSTLIFISIKDLKHIA